jgi:hypothetical protein
MKFSAIFLLLIIPVFACAEDGVIADFILGKYLLVGKGVDTQQTYTGEIIIYRDDKGLKLIRMINGQSTVADVGFETTLGGDKEVIRIRFKQADKSYEETCLWQSDLDNYARISCYLYHSGNNTKDPGMEVMFHDHTAD